MLRLSGPLAGHADSVVTPFLLPDIPVVAWWPVVAPAVPAQDPLGKLAIRRITDATNGDDPLAAIKSRLPGYTAGDTDLAWTRITYWRALLTSAVDQPPHEPIESALVSGLKTEPALDVLAGWLASRIDGPVRRVVGELKVELVRKSRDHHAEPAAGGHHGHAEPDRPARMRWFRWRAGKPVNAWPKTCVGWIPTRSTSPRSRASRRCSTHEHRRRDLPGQRRPWSRPRAAGWSTPSGPPWRPGGGH